MQLGFIRVLTVLRRSYSDWLPIRSERAYAGFLCLQTLRLQTCKSDLDKENER